MSGGFDPVSLAVTLALLALLPTLAVVCTSFLKIAIVLSLVRNALGVQQVQAEQIAALPRAVDIQIGGHALAARGARTRVVQTDVERGLVLVEGAVPGTAGGWIFLRDAIKRALPKDAPQPGKFRLANGATEAAPAQEEKKED